MLLYIFKSWQILRIRGRFGVIAGTHCSKTAQMSIKKNANSFTGKIEANDMQRKERRAHSRGQTLAIEALASIPQVTGLGSTYRFVIEFSSQVRGSLHKDHSFCNSDLTLCHRQNHKMVAQHTFLLGNCSILSWFDENENMFLYMVMVTLLIEGAIQRNRGGCLSEMKVCCLYGSTHVEK